MNDITQPLHTSLLRHYTVFIYTIRHLNIIHTKFYMINTFYTLLSRDITEFRHLNITHLKLYKINSFYTLYFCALITLFLSHYKPIKYYTFKCYKIFTLVIIKPSQTIYKSIGKSIYNYCQYLQSTL